MLSGKRFRRVEGTRPLTGSARWNPMPVSIGSPEMGYFPGTPLMVL